MKSLLKKFGLLLLFSLLAFSSCRKENMEFEQAPEEEIISANSTVANLVQRTAMHDGSFDNIIDRASCFSITLPVTVIANGIEVVVETRENIEIIEDIFDEFTDDPDTIEIIFPITIVLADYTRMEINSQSELIQAASLCPGENVEDEDIECIDFQFPMSSSIFNLNNELIDTVTINGDEELFNFIKDIDQNLIVTFQFPITVLLSDGSSASINNFVELQSIVESSIDSCDEDDDNDPNDDDCDNCTTQQLEDLLTGCSDWMVDKLERNNIDLEDIYVGYLFNFSSNGTLTVDYSGNQSTGTWTSSGAGNGITVTVDIPDLPDFNDAWNLHEIEQQPGEFKVDLRLGEDRLRFESDCISGGGGGGGLNTGPLVAVLTTGDWYVTYYFDDGDETSNYADYVFNYATNNTATATNSSGPTNGTWSISAGDETELELNLNFGTTPPLDELAEDWDVLEATNDIIRLKDISGGNGTTEFLTFERQPFGGGGGGGGATLEGILEDGTWIVDTYIDSGNNETGDYAGYNIDFDPSGTVIATNGSNPNSGTWQVLNSGNKLLLDFGTSFPFEEFNDDWDVVSATATRVELQDVSGGGGGTDILIFEKL